MGWASPSDCFQYSVSRRLLSAHICGFTAKYSSLLLLTLSVRTWTPLLDLTSDVWTSDHAEPGRNGAQLYSEVREVDARRRRFRHGPMTRGRSKARRKFFECHINYTAMSKRRVQTSEF